MSRDITEVIDDYSLNKYGHTNWVIISTLSDQEKVGLDEVAEIEKIDDVYVAFYFDENEGVYDETEIWEWKYGKEYEHKVFRMSLAEMRSLEEEYFTPEMSNAWDKLYYSLLDHKKLREKFVREKLEKDHKNNLREVNDDIS